MSSTTPVFKIIPTIQQYDWGTVGPTSKVAQLASNIPGFALQDTAPYAELWMGTHPTSPARLPASNKTLAEHLAAHPTLMGESVIQRFDASDGNLPFLFKVLAIQKALSIQTHPDKQTAEKLHAEQPDIYKDANHKPELALALTPFRALCGFLPLPQIAAYIRAVPELTALIPSPITRALLLLATSTPPTPTHSLAEKAALKAFFQALISAPPPTVKDHLAALTRRYQSGSTHRDVESPALVELVLRLDAQFPGDVGVFCAYMLNYVQLEPGEAIFLGAGEPHAYISGDIIECMANSDNVIRAGLTPKLRDIPNLVAGLTYAAAPPAKHRVHPVSFPPAPADTTSDSTARTRIRSVLYDPPIPEFAVVQLALRAGEAETHRAVGGPSVCVVTEGRGVVCWGEGGGMVEVGLGEVVFVGAGTAVKWEAAAGDGMVVHRAYVEVD